MDHPTLDKLNFSQAKNFFITCHGGFNEKINRSIESAKNKKTFFFPHGFPLCENKLLTIKQLAPLNQHEENKLDVKIVTDKFSSGKNTVRLNSLRFSPQWVQWKISHERPFEWNLNSKLKIAVIFPKDDINTFISEVWRTCQVALQFPSCSVAVSHRGTYLPKEAPNEVKNSERFCWPSPDVSTISILNWADIVIHNGTTLHADCMLLNKVVIVPKYLSCNKTYCETYGSALIAETRDDLYYFFKAANDDFEKFKKEKHLPITENHRQFMNDFFSCRRS
jgi:hypothetical protein